MCFLTKYNFSINKSKEIFIVVVWLFLSSFSFFQCFLVSSYVLHFLGVSIFIEKFFSFKESTIHCLKNKAKKNQKKRKKESLVQIMIFNKNISWISNSKSPWWNSMKTLHRIFLRKNLKNGALNCFSSDFELMVKL